MTRIAKIILLGLLINLGCCLSPAGAAATAGQAEYLTKGEAVNMLAATDFMKKKINQLVSWTVGYDISKVNRVRLTPVVNYIKVMPRMVPPDGRTIFEVLASVDDPAGINNIQGVRANLSPIGQLSDTVLVDNGLFGDTKAQDGVFTLQTSVSQKIDLGAKEVEVTVANKKGWLALAKGTLDVEKNPVIKQAKLTPDSVPADGKTPVNLAVNVESPGRISDIKNVTVDLRSLSYTDLLPLRNDGLAGDEFANDSIFSVEFTVPPFVAPGEYLIRVGALNAYSGYSDKAIKLKVTK